MAEAPALLRRIVPSEFNSYAWETERLGPLFADGGGTSRARPRGGPGDEGDPVPEGREAASNPGSSSGQELRQGARERGMGTLTHRLIELRIRSLRDGGSTELDLAWAAALLGGVAGEELVEAMGEAKQMAERFFESKLWSRLKGAERLETELSVLARYDHPRLGDLYVQGQFDLFAEHQGGCEIVDFKSDRELRPEEYRYQLSLYSYAARELSGKEPRVTLFGLRDGSATELRSLKPEAMDELLASYVLG